MCDALCFVYQFKSTLDNGPVREDVLSEALAERHALLSHVFQDILNRLNERRREWRAALSLIQLPRWLVAESARALAVVLL